MEHLFPCHGIKGLRGGGYRTYACFVLLLAMAVAGKAQPTTKEASSRKVFIINNCITDLATFQKLVTMAEKLKAYGRVQVNIGTLADKGFYEMPKERSPWHDYASNNSTPYKFFPHPSIAPFVPAAFVARNRQLLLAKAKIVRDHGMEAAFFGSEPNMLPEAFFDAHPEMLGPRVDHPRRSNHPAFAPCVDAKETLEIYSSMMAEMLRNAPEIKTFYFKTNDAGAGICWGAWLYTGPNGPAWCKNETMGARIVSLMNAFRSGAEKARTRLDVYLSEPQGSSNFSDEERDEIQSHLPRDCFFKSASENEMIYLNSGITSNYPIRGIVDPFAFLEPLQSFSDERRQTIFITFRSWYSKGNESPDAMDLSLSLLEGYLRARAKGINPDSRELIRELCGEWAAGKGDELYRALWQMHEGFQFRETLGSLLPINWNVAARLVNRPLVAVPQRLSKNEEAYFLPFVFNVSEEEARADYMDIQGSRRTTRPDSVRVYVEKMKAVSKALEAISPTAPGPSFTHQLALALRINASFARSCGNFFVAQALRDKNAGRLNGPIHRPDKEPTWTGDADLLTFNEVMRDELDNSQELIEILNKGGINLVCRAADAAHEDCFLLGPDLVKQVRQKRQVMLDHWRDIEDYMTTPFK